MADYLPKWAVAETNYPGDLSRGANDHGGEPRVKRVQEWCTFHGSATGIDGDFGPATELALKDFQTRNHLPVTGALDQTTWSRLIAPMQTVLTGNTAGVGEPRYDVVVRTARRHLAVNPVEIGGQNKGPWVRLYMRGTDGAGELWCAGFSCFVLTQANVALGHTGSPIPYRVGVDALVDDAKGSGRFIPEATPHSTALRPGCLFVERSATDATDWIHTGIVIAPHAEAFQTIEGNSNQDGSTNGYEVCSNHRAYRRFDFIKLD